MLNPSEIPEVNRLLDRLVDNLRGVLKENIAGIYLYGSLVWGDFDIEISDIDLMAATATSLSEKEFFELKEMQDAFVQEYKEWDDRLEIAYLSLHALRTFKKQQSQIAIVSIC